MASRELTPWLETPLGRIYHDDSLNVMRGREDASVDMILTSPPFALTRKKDYGNEQEDEYLEWFRSFAVEFRRILKEDGSLVIDLGGAWKPGIPVRSLYHFKLLIMLCEEYDFHLAQEFYWWNPSKLPTPAEWVNIRRVRVKDAVNTVWWLAKSPWPKASNRRVLQPYSDSMRDLLSNGYKAKLRPSGHDISEKFSRDNGASIPPNLIAVPNTESNSRYLRYCAKNDVRAHPARFPASLPEYFIRMATDRGDLVLDPFGGSCVSGEVAERLERKWVCVEVKEEYLRGAKGRFEDSEQPCTTVKSAKKTSDVYYRIPHPGLLWDDAEHDPLPADGGRKRPRISPEAAFAPLVEQVETLAKELFRIRERANADDQDYVDDQSKCQPVRLRHFKRRLNERMESFERRLSSRRDPDWIEDGLGRFESYAWGLSSELSALREELDESHDGFSRLLGDFQNEVDERVETFAAALRAGTG